MVKKLIRAAREVQAKGRLSSKRQLVANQRLCQSIPGLRTFFHLASSMAEHAGLLTDYRWLL